MNNWNKMFLGFLVVYSGVDGLKIGYIDFVG